MFALASNWRWLQWAGRTRWSSEILINGSEFCFCFFLKIRVFFLFCDRVRVQVVVGSGGGFRVSRTQSLGFLGSLWLLWDCRTSGRLRALQAHQHCPSRLFLWGFPTETYPATPAHLSSPRMLPRGLWMHVLLHNLTFKTRVGALSVPLLMSISEAISVLFHCNETSAAQKLWVIKPGPWSWS